MLRQLIIIFLGIIFSLFAFAQSSSEPVIYLTPMNDSPPPHQQAVNPDQDNVNSDADVVPVPVQSQPADIAPVRKVIHKRLAKTYGPTTAEENIWSIAEKLRPSAAVTVQQTIIALQQLNPQAFEQDNINALRNGQRLHVPTVDQIQLTTAVTAATLVAQQDRQWQELKTTPKIAANETKSTSTTIKDIALIAMNNKTKANEKNISDKQLINLNPTPNIDTLQIKQLQQQMVTAQNDMRNYEQTTNQEINHLAQQNSTVEGQLSTINQTVNDAKTEIVDTAKNLDQRLSKESLQQNIPDMNQSGLNSLLPRNKVSWWILGIAIFLIILLWIPRPKKIQQNNHKKRQEPSVTLQEEHLADHDLKNEYDFMNSEEGIPAKLDLARAYIDMDDTESATQVLQEIVEKGNKTEQKKAQQLLKKISGSR